jgi:hypothetical protein
MTKKKIDDEVIHCLEVLSGLEPGSDRYGAVANDLNTICEARSKKPSSPIDWNTIIGSGTAFGQVLAIIFHERLNVIASKAIGFVVKSRI